MSLNQIALILEIIGFALATIFAGILLNREVVGRFADRVTTKFNEFSDKLIKQYLTLNRYTSLFLEVDSKLGTNILGAIAIRGGAVACMISGWLTDITWLFWVGIAVAFPYVIMNAVFSCLRILSLRGKGGMWFYPILLLWTLILSFIVAPVALLTYPLLFFSHGILTLAVTTLVGKDIIKKGLIIFGSVLVITGLILEFIYTFCPSG